jgi:hypothetical protein
MPIAPELGVLMVALFVWVGVYLYLRRDTQRDDTADARERHAATERRARREAMRRTASETFFRRR